MDACPSTRVVNEILNVQQLYIKMIGLARSQAFHPAHVYHLQYMKAVHAGLV